MTCGRVSTIDDDPGGDGGVEHSEDQEGTGEVEFVDEVEGGSVARVECPCSEEPPAPIFTQTWQFTDEGFIAEGHDGSPREYDDPSEIPGSPWSLSEDGFRVRIDWENSANCGGSNSNRQIGTAVATIETDRDLLMTVTWSGKGEIQDPSDSNPGTYEHMALLLDDEEIGMARSPGGGFGCTDLDTGEHVRDVVSFPPSPQQVLVRTGTRVLRINADTVDGLYHIGAWYQFELTFEEA